MLYAMKRVWCLYRVSTKQQVSMQDDLPIQQTACHSFVESKVDWCITNELIEKGISGWSKRAADRAIIQQLLAAAESQQFDILLLSMLDRLGRREDELPFIMSALHEAGIEVWSVHEGKWQTSNHTDKLLNYIRFWQAEGESIKTSIRVKEAKRQLSAAGKFQGGTIPYGYQLVDSSEPHWKEKHRFQKMLKPLQKEAEVVKLIYNFYTENYYSYRKIVDKLTKEGYYNRQGKPFCISTIKRILENPIYIGKARYSSLQDGVQPYNEQLQIITNEQYELARSKQQRKQITSK